jgi:hypothetical protein
MSKNNGLKNIEQSKAAKRMNLADWRAAQMRELELPSGLTVKVRNVDITDLALQGRIPNTLMDVFVNAAEAQDEKSAEKLAGDAIKNNAEEFGKMLNAVVTAAFVEPRIGDVADDEHITLEEIPMGDKLFVFNELNQEVAKVRSFRDGEDEPRLPA